MTKVRRNKLIRPLQQSVLTLVFCAVASPLFAQLMAPVHRHDFESLPLATRLESPGLASVLKLHQLNDDSPHAGQRCELLIFDSPQLVEERRLSFAIPNARVFDELSASLWVRSNRAGVRLGVRIRCPHQGHPKTGEPLEIELFGDPCAPSQQWQQVVCRTSDEAVRGRVIRARGQLAAFGSSQLDDRDMYIDQVIVSFQLPEGGSILQFDDLEFGPIVVPPTLVEEPVVEEEVTPPALTIVDDHIQKRGEPFYPLFLVYHGESLEEVQRTGVNMLWIPDYTDRPLLTALADMDIGAIAQPPMPTLEQVSLQRAALPTIPTWTNPVWAWMLGFDVPSAHRAYVTGWAEQVRDADRHFRRPIMADVAGSEREFHRQIDLLGSSRFGIHTAVSASDHFEQLRGRRDFALPGKPMFTFVQTEASDALLDQRDGSTSIPIVEPEQILHQAYEAIAAGFKGIGFWKTIPLNSDLPGLNERTCAIEIFSAHCRLLEPWLATASILDQIPVDTRGDRRDKVARNNPLTSRWDPLIDPLTKVETEPGADSQVRATILRTNYGLIILPLWHESGAQYVPGPQKARDAYIRVRGIGDVSQAWEVTPTSVGQANLAMNRVAGGTEIHLKDFDQSTIIVITNNQAGAEELRRRVRLYRRSASDAFVRLAELKTERVSDVHRQLANLAPAIPHADALLNRAASFARQARQELESDHPDEARISSQRALQHLRALQRAHWEAATGSATSTVSSMDAVSFQTLPDHYRLLNEIGSATNPSPNLLPSGGFEDETQLFSSWRDGSGENRFTSLRLSEGGSEGKMHLTMMVKPNAPQGQPAVLIGPEVPVRAGEIVLITGDFSLPGPLKGVENDFTIFETLVGRSGGLRFEERTNGWQSFRILRRVRQDGTLRVRFELSGPGIAHLDNVRVRTVSPSGLQTTSFETRPETGPSVSPNTPTSLRP